MDSLHDKFPLSMATVEIIEFGDFICPRSREAHKIVDTVVESFKGQLSYKYRHFPDPDNNQSLLAALALEAAKRQGQFSPMYRLLLAQSAIELPTLLAQTHKLSLNQHQFMQDLLDDRLHHIVKEDWQTGYELGVRCPPTLFVGGQRFHGKLTLSRLLPLVRFQVSRFSEPLRFDGIPLLDGFY